MITTAFWYLTERSIRNRIVHQVKSLKRPRYAVAMLFGFLYIWSVYLRPGARADRPQFSVGDDAAIIAATLIAIMIAAWWVFGGDRTALAFSPAEVQFLFPAPVTRGDLIRFKLLRAQPQVLLSVLIWVVLFKRGGPSPLPMLMRVIAFWVVFSTLHMHRLGASLVRANAAQHGRAGVKRAFIAYAIVWSAMAALIGTIVVALPRLQIALSNGDFIPTVAAVVRQPVPGAILAPVRWLIAPLFAHDTASWLSTIWPALLLAVLHYFWVVRTHAAFEDAAVEASARRAERLAAMRGRRMGAPLDTGSKAAAKASRERPARIWIPISPTGHPAVAILWKNIVSIAREVRRSTLLLLIVGTLAIYLALSKAQEGSDLRPGSYLLIGMAGFLAVVGPMWIRNDLR
ncbi:MAG: putative ABC exporter domain-containing protein, partial [Gemmatimonadota bacterium]|nr:putative ABC exporter domain-containing protein [Gemmatimonadota bacterium]